MIADELAEEWAEQKVADGIRLLGNGTGPADKSTDAFNVSILAASRPWISQVWRDCRQSGLDCWAVDGVPLAMARAVALGGRTRRRAAGFGGRLGIFEYDAVRRGRRPAAVHAAAPRLWFREGARRGVAGCSA